MANTGPWHLIGSAHDGLYDPDLPRKTAKSQETPNPELNEVTKVVAKTTTLNESEKLSIIEEDGEASNLHKLNLEGTHYLDENEDFDSLLFTLW